MIEKIMGENTTTNKIAFICLQSFLYENFRSTVVVNWQFMYKILAIHSRSINDSMLPASNDECIFSEVFYC